MSPVSWGDIFTLPLWGDRIMELRQFDSQRLTTRIGKNRLACEKNYVALVAYEVPWECRGGGMPHFFASKFRIIAALAVMLAGVAGNAHGQGSYPPPNDLPNPYHAGTAWGQLPDGRKWGST